LEFNQSEERKPISSLGCG